MVYKHVKDNIMTVFMISGAVFIVVLIVSLCVHDQMAYNRVFDELEERFPIGSGVVIKRMDLEGRVVSYFDVGKDVSMCEICVRYYDDVDRQYKKNGFYVDELVLKGELDGKVELKK